jgi:thiosulfate/3-mercaptopyruvate sulfurtransferase
MTAAGSLASVAPLVSAEWLAMQLGKVGVALIDIRSAVDGGGHAAYCEVHVPSAAHTDYVKDGWRATKGLATGLLPDRAHLSALFGRLGIAPDRHVIVISAGTNVGDFSAAARVYWTLRVTGHRKVSILDGGMHAWRADSSRPVESGMTSPHPAQPYPVRLVAGLRSDTPAVERALAAQSSVMLDSRAPGFFAGREKSPQARRAGRLPGAMLLDHKQAFDTQAKRLRPLGDLQRLFAQVPDGPVVNYCNTGHQAATNWFILSELLGRRDVTLYDGSMSEWTDEGERPVETGEA